ncbi:hypothetical protein [Aliikangiella coralliicola]|uniref:Uncharacterized protein n=1 Tax=Aliikangiella coralliicola TaxID=2592383 RepID=A0A545U065_9GAMM|nr:hypothetical protein [Aliikangiella coralliicola]TQV82858.1 hypothetical protein FLL46_24115 [Aliikangiella coralliicola]
MTKSKSKTADKKVSDAAEDFLKEQEEALDARAKLLDEQEKAIGSEKEKVTAERKALEDEKARVQEEQALLNTERNALQQARAALEMERDALEKGKQHTPLLSDDPDFVPPPYLKCVKTGRFFAYTPALAKQGARFVAATAEEVAAG